MIITSRAPVRVDFAGAWTDVKYFSQGAGGVVVNATIDKYVEGRLETESGDHPEREGIRVSYQCDLPSGSGLGTSSALNVCWLSLIESQLAPTDENRAHIADLAYRLEELLGILGGKQDQYAAALGGFNCFTFGESVQIERLPVAPAVVAELQQRLVLCYTGKSRLSGSIHENVWGAFQRGVPETVNALYALREGALRLRDALKSEDTAQTVATFGQILGESWMHQRALDPSVTNAVIEHLFTVATEAGAPQGKACGAGGGGCLLFFAEVGRKNAVSQALTEAGARVIPFAFEFDGLQVHREAV